jgi:HAD superfamily hydrolase (TIGR01490 family)
MKSDLVVFDFCETLVNFQTADAFVEFILKNSKNSWRNFYYQNLIEFFRKVKIISFCNKFFSKMNVEKRLKAFALFGIDKDRLHVLSQKYFYSEICRSYNIEVLNALRNHKMKGDFLVVSSGGYDIYLEEFCKSEKIDFLNCTRIKFILNRCTGFFDGKDCMFDEKVFRVRKLIFDNRLNFERKIVYSDSANDIPLFKWADIAIVVTANKLEWPIKYGFQQFYI